MSEKPQCSRRVYDGTRADFTGHGCEKQAKFEIEGKWYCAIHDPKAVKRRDAVREAKRQAQLKADREKDARKAYDCKAGDMCRELGIADPTALRDECARLREALLKVKPELYCMDKQLIASGYKRGASVAEAMKAMESALTPPEQKRGAR